MLKSLKIDDFSKKERTNLIFMSEQTICTKQMFEKKSINFYLELWVSIGGRQREHLHFGF